MAKTNKGRKFFATTATAALVASAIVPVASAAQVNDFNSIASYAQEAVQDLVDRGVVQGDANGNFQPRKSVSRAEAATILTGALGLSTSENVYFTDVKSGAWYYDAINAAVNNGVFSGKGEGKFDPNGNLTRGEAAVILVNAFGLEGSASLAQFADEKSVKAWAKEALEIAVGNGVVKGDNGQIKANDAITKQDFAVMFSRAEAASDVAETASSVKAINATTVEVSFADVVGNVDELKFAIDGLEIKNVAPKQSDAKTVVLTTAAQEAGKEYTVTVNGDAVGKFVGVSAVIPTAVTVVEFQNPVVEKETTQVNSHKSQQAPLGTQVTLKAQVTVAEGQSKAGIPVTFNIIDVSEKNTAYASLNQPILAEATTDENGVATYTYTRYASTAQGLITNDEVQVYATGNPTARDFSKVYWANTQPLTITEVTTGNKLNNGSKKVYKVKLAGVNRATELERPTGARYINLGFLDNVNIAPDKANKGVTVTDASGRNLGYPGQFTTTNSTETNRFNAVRINLDANGEATFTLTGSNETVTPFVWHDDAVGNTNATVDRFDKTELVAFAAPITFAKEQVLNVKIESLGTKDASAYQESFDRSGAYEYRNGNLVLVRDPNGLLTGANPLLIPAGATRINENNPVRANEVVPSGFAYVSLTNTGVRGVDALETRLANTHLAKFAYTGTVKAKQAALVADLQNTGGRDYKVSYTDKDGKAAQSGQVVKVELKYGSAKTNATASATPIYFIDNNSHTVYKVSDFSKDKAEFTLVTDAKGQVSFTVIGGRDSYATPTAFVETGDKTGLDTNDAQDVGEIVYFGDRTINSAKLTIDNEDTVSKSVAEEVTFSYQSTDQNKKHYYTTNENFIATFQVSTTFAPAVVKYIDRNGVQQTKTVGQGSTESFDVKALNGKADIHVSSSRGNRVDVKASANSLPILDASATFTTLNNEGIAFGQSVRGKVIAVDKDNDRILLTDSKGERIYDLKFEKDELFYKGVGASESTFESHLNVGDELFFTQKADANSKAKFDNLDIASGIVLNNVDTNRKTFIIDGDYTSTLKEYDFQYAGTNVPVGTVTPQTINANFQINGDNIKLKNVNIIGNVTVGNTNATEAQVLNDFTLDGVTVSGDVKVNQGDGDTFNVTGNSKLNRVVLNIKEHVAIATGSEITTLVVTNSGTKVTGAAGAVEKIVASTGVTVVQEGGLAAPIVTEDVALFTAKTTTGDTVELTFTAGSNVTGITSTNIGTVAGTVASTTLDVATITFANTAVVGKTIDVTFNHNGVTKTYTLSIGAVGNAATITRKY